MKKIIVPFLFLLLLFKLNTSPAYSDSCWEGDIQNFEATVDGNEVAFTITEAAPTSSNRTLYIIINPQFLTGTEIPSVPIFIDENGSGSAATTVNVKGAYIAYVYNMFDARLPGAIPCSVPALFTIIVGLEPTPTPSPSPECRDLGESCVPGVTPLCDSINYVCSTIDGMNYNVYRKDDPLIAPTPPPKGIDIHGDCDKDKGEIDTAIGCIPTKNANAFIKWFLGRAILLAGGIAFLMMIAGAFMVIVSSGDPEKVKAGSQLVTSAVAGLVFIIFSLFLLRLIGIEILQIPGL